MAKKAEAESLFSYFKRIFRENPKWLRKKANDEVLQRYADDHPGEEVNQRIRQNMANVKSQMRKKQGIGRRGKKRKENGEAPEVVKPTSAQASGKILERLEVEIDECLSRVRQLGDEQLGDVVKLLRRARNIVVYKMGEP